MSYSFNVKAATKALAMAAVASKFAEIVASQPIHARDRAAVLANAEASIGLLTDDDSKDVAVSCNGYVSWSGVGEFTPETAALQSASIACSANYVHRD